jgi:nucleoid DNA-binding protein
MNELIQSLQEKVGLSADQAKDAVNHVMDYVKSKLPASLHEHLDAAAIGNTIKAKGAELFAQAQSTGGDVLKSVEEKVSGFLHSKEA